HRVRPCTIKPRTICFRSPTGCHELYPVDGSSNPFGSLVLDTLLLSLDRGNFGLVRPPKDLRTKKRPAIRELRTAGRIRFSYRDSGSKDDLGRKRPSYGKDLLCARWICRFPPSTVPPSLMFGARICSLSSEIVQQAAVDRASGGSPRTGT